MMNSRELNMTVEVIRKNIVLENSRQRSLRSVYCLGSRIDSSANTGGGFDLKLFTNNEKSISFQG